MRFSGFNYSQSRAGRLFEFSIQSKFWQPTLMKTRGLRLLIPFCNQALDYSWIPPANAALLFMAGNTSSGNTTQLMVLITFFNTFRTVQTYKASIQIV